MSHNRVADAFPLRKHDARINGQDCAGTLCADCGCCIHCDESCAGCSCADAACGCNEGGVA